MTAFHNTVQLHGPTLHAAETRAQSQQERILDFFRRNPGRHFTPGEVFANLPCKILLTSVRRCMTDLTRAGYLEKTKLRTPGAFGMNNYNWRLAERKPEQRSLWAWPPD